MFITKIADSKSARTVSFDNANAWDVFFHNGNLGAGNKNYHGYVRAVRGGS